MSINKDKNNMNYFILILNIEYNGTSIHKPFVEKPVDAEGKAHRIVLY